jgi:DNA-binding response OmpR family regulator
MIEQNIHVLLVEDDHRLALLTKEYLETHGITVVHVAKGEAALEVLSQNHFTAIILDIMLPDMGGYEVCRRIRTFSDVPILILTALDGEGDIVMGIEFGADDYICKPFSSAVLLARIRSCARRYLGHFSTKKAIVTSGHLQLRPTDYSVSLRGHPIHLTPHEFQLLYELASRPNLVLSRERLLELTHQDLSDAFDRSIDAHISRLRAKLGDNPRSPTLIITVRGRGYQFIPPEQN